MCFKHRNQYVITRRPKATWHHYENGRNLIGLKRKETGREETEHKAGNTCEAKKEFYFKSHVQPLVHLNRESRVAGWEQAYLGAVLGSNLHSAPYKVRQLDKPRYSFLTETIYLPCLAQGLAPCLVSCTCI